MTPAEALREKLDVSIFADELFGENCFLIRRRDTAAALVVDPGLQLDRVVRQLREERLTVERILVTHGHIDHVGGVPALHQDTGAPIAMHPDDLAILDWDQLGRLPFIPRGFGPFSIDLGLTHGMTLSFADLSVRVLHTPGHTEGSVCFLFGLDCRTQSLDRLLHAREQQRIVQMFDRWRQESAGGINVGHSSA